MTFRPLFAVALLWALSAAAETAAPGHSMQGEAFDEGPRQFAVLMPGVSGAHFPITSSRPQAQEFFDQGLTQLHGFWYFEAERSFRQVAWLDRDCAMAYCGMALANINNEKRAAGFIKEAVARKAHASPREARWIDLWNAYFTAEKKKDRVRRERLVTDFEELILDFPDDLEARAFLLLQLWDNSSHNLPLPSRLAVASLADPVLARYPMHPGVHHYLIHLWNEEKRDRHALPDAAACGQSAPGIAHLWHMGGHTYSALQRYADAAWQQEASARTDHAYLARSGLMPEQIHNYAHNNQWLVNDLSYVGRVGEAWALAKNLVELPRLGPEKEAAWRMGRDRLLELGLHFELWDKLTALDGTPYLDPDPDPARETSRLRALGVAWYRQGDATRGDAKAAALQGRLEAMRAERVSAGDRAEAEAKKQGKTEEEIAKALGTALRGFDGRLATLQNALADLRLARALAAGEMDEARRQLASCSDLDPIRLAQAQAILGDLPAVEKALRKPMEEAPQALLSAMLAAAQEKAGRPEEAAKTFAALRSQVADDPLTVPAFARLAPLASRLAWPADWRLPRPPAADVGERPALESLGPFLWQPAVAPPLSLPDEHGQTVALPGARPVLVLFYLGAGCAKCVEQLNTFAPFAKAFAEAGIDLVAVSTEAPENLHQTLGGEAGEAFPFPVLSDHGLQSFRAFRAFDEFENSPLHGAFLIDTAHRVRWQNIGFQPFTKPAWLLEESKRLLALPAKG